MRIGVSGGHRVGKTSLCKRLADELGIEFVQGSATPIFQKFGRMPADALPFAERLEIQFELLNDYERRLSGKSNFITDRNPIDYIAYTLAELNNAVATEQVKLGELRLSEYISKCYEVSNTCLDMGLLVQPGIPLMNDDTKGVCSLMMIEKLNLLMASSVCDYRSMVPFFIIDREVIDMGGRIDVSMGAIQDFFGESALKVSIH